jgi:hypothetical protein
MRRAAIVELTETAVFPVIVPPEVLNLVFAVAYAELAYEPVVVFNCVTVLESTG